MAIIKVVCGIIFKNDLVLICRRKPEKSLGGYWEFPGGKVEASESYEESLRRELIEELNLTVKIKRHFRNAIHHNEKNPIELISLICTTEDAVIESTDHDLIEWVKLCYLSAFFILNKSTMQAKWIKLTLTSISIAGIVLTVSLTQTNGPLIPILCYSTPAIICGLFFRIKSS